MGVGTEICDRRWTQSVGPAKGGFGDNIIVILDCGLAARRNFQGSIAEVRRPDKGRASPRARPFRLQQNAFSKNTNPIAASTRPHGIHSGKCLVVVSVGYPKPPPAGDGAPWGCLPLSDRPGAARDICRGF